MAETEVSKEVSKVAAIEKNCVLDMSSYQDLPKPDSNGTNHHNQANDLDNSYVFVSGVTEDVSNEAEDSRVLPESDAAGVKDQGAELHSQIGAASGEFQPLNEAEGIIERSDGDTPLVNVDNKGLSVLPESDVTGIKEQAAELHSQIEISDAANGEYRPLNEVENIIIEQVNGDLSSVNADNKDVEAEGLSVLPELGAAGVEDQVPDLHSHIEKIGSGEFQPLNEAKNNIIEPSNGDPPLVDVDNMDVEAEGLNVLLEPDAAVVKDQGTELHSQIENYDAVSVEFQPLNEAENSITERSNWDPSLASIGNKVVEAEGFSGLPESDAAGVKDQGEELHSQIKKNDAVSGNFQPLNDAENSVIAGPPLVNVDNEDVVDAEGSNVLPESDAAGVKDRGAELHSQTENIDAVSQPMNEAENSIIGDPPLVNVNNEDVVEAEGLGVLPGSDAAGLKVQVSELHSQIENIDAVSKLQNEAETDGLSVVFEPNAAEIKDQGAELGSPNENFDAVESRNVEQMKEYPTSLNDSTSKHESFLENGEAVQVSLDDSLKEHAGKTETETGVKNVQDPDGKIESLAEAEVEKALDQNGIVEDVAKGEDEKFDDVPNAEASPVPAENQVPKVVALGSVAESGENKETNNILLHVNNSLSANGECEDQSNLCVIEAFEAHHESQEMVVDAVQRELQDATVDNDDEVKSVREVEEPVDKKVSPSTSASHAVHSKAETLDEEAKTTSCSEVLENQHDETTISNSVQDVLGQMDESKTVGSSTDSHDQTVYNLVGEVQNENFHVSEVDTGFQTQSHPVSDAHAPQSENFDAETIGAASTVCQKSQITGTLSPSYGSGIRCPDEVVLTEKEPASQGDDTCTETDVSIGKVEDAVCPPVVKLEPEGHGDAFSAISEGGKRDDVAVSCRTEVSEAADVLLDVEGTEDIRDQLDAATDSGNDNLFMQENEDTGNSQCSKMSGASAGSTNLNTSDGKEQSVKLKTKPFNFLIRIPRFDDENLREQIRVAKIHVDEKTKLRDAVQIQIQEKRANSQVHGIDYEFAKSEARSARKLVRSKRMEIDSLQSVINKAKNALSIEDIDSQIYNMEHMIQHETLPLKEEKQLIREIKQLKQLREQLSSNMGSQDEIKQAIEQRGEVEERLKILRKELDILKNKVLKAEATAAEAEKKYDDENKKIRDLQAQFRAADDVRQAAYAEWQNLRKELSKKSEHFFKYKDDAAVASNFAYSRDTEALYLLCMNQVDNFMELWNKNEEFRREYVKFNTRSSVRRFGTLDGRALGPDEVPPRLPSYAEERASRMASTSVKVVDLPSPIPSPEVKKEMANENTDFDNKVTKKAMESNYQKVTKEAAISVQQVNGLDTHSVEVYKEAVISKEEMETLRREEEKRREETEAKLKEQRRVEALVKANEARERKKRQAEKLQMRADLKTQKEAEQREKEREKRLRKKERKKGGDGNDMKSINCESSESAAESSKDMEVVVNETVSKKQQPQQKPWLLGKQSKAKPIPPPLRNRNKKKLQQWMWVGVTSVMILVLFWLGNIGVFSNVAIKRRGPLH